MHIMNPLQRMIVEKLCQSIKSKRLVKFFYEDTTDNFRDWRIVAPHMVWKNKKTQNIILMGWFLPTDIQKAYGQHKPDWKNYLIDAMDYNLIQELPDRFNKTAKGYKGNSHRSADFIYCYTPIVL